MVTSSGMILVGGNMPWSRRLVFAACARTLGTSRQRDGDHIWRQRNWRGVTPVQRTNAR
jgi:hypothetical protein